MWLSVPENVTNKATIKYENIASTDEEVVKIKNSSSNVLT